MCLPGYKLTQRGSLSVGLRVNMGLLPNHLGHVSRQSFAIENGKNALKIEKNKILDLAAPLTSVLPVTS